MRRLASGAGRLCRDGAAFAGSAGVCDAGFVGVAALGKTSQCLCCWPASPSGTAAGCACEGVSQVPGSDAVMRPRVPRSGHGFSCLEHLQTRGLCCAQFDLVHSAQRGGQSSCCSAMSGQWRWSWQLCYLEQ